MINVHKIFEKLTNKKYLKINGHKIFEKLTVKNFLIINKSEAKEPLLRGTKKCKTHIHTNSTHPIQLYISFYFTIVLM